VLYDFAGVPHSKSSMWIVPFASTLLTQFEMATYQYDGAGVFATVIVYSLSVIIRVANFVDETVAHSLFRILHTLSQSVLASE